MPAPSQENKAPDVAERTPQMPQTESDHEQNRQEYPTEIQNALRDLIMRAEREADFGRRGHYREMLEAEEFWKGNQYPIWSEKNFNFRTPWDYALSQGRVEDMPVYQYVINIYQATGLTVIAALSQKVPKVRFFPHSAKSEVDIATARAASDIAELIEKNNNLRMLAIREAYLLWTQGGFGTYTRFVRDERQGLEQVPNVEMSTVPITEDRYDCPQCGYEVPAGEVGGEPAVDPFGQERMLMSCPQCGGELTDANFMPGETADVPVVSSYDEVPAGYEKMSVYGFLNLKLPPYAQNQEGCGYLALVEDVDEAAIRAAYFGMHKDINVKAIDDFQHYTGNDGDLYEKTGRMRLFDAATPYGGMRSGMVSYAITYKRVWLRRWYFMGHPDPQMREKLWNMFPDGAFVAFAGDQFLEARNENLEDHWSICTAMPSWGLYGPSIGSSTIPLQKQINDAGNIVAEHLDFGSAPPIMYDAMFLSGEALGKQKMRPATFIPVTRSRGGQAHSLKDLMHQPDMKIDTNIFGYGRTLVEMVQVVSGAMPSLFGGQMRGNETASAYAQSRDQALGKLQLFWAAVKQHHASVMRQGVECFRRNRTGDTEKVILGKSNDFVSKYIRLADLKGSIIAEPEADEDFPQTWNEIRANLNEMMTTNPDIASAIFNEPANVALMKKYLGSPLIVFSAEANREKQFREIDELLMAEPIGVPDPAAMDPMTGLPLVVDPMTGQPPIKYLPTVAPEVHGDDHLVHIKAIQEWVVDPDGGILAKKDNPGGFANVMAHLIAHKEAQGEVAAFDQKIAAAAGLLPAPGEEGGNESGSPPSKKP